LDTPSYVSW